jgi:uncharacterized membrane protein YphA (DoxX/SURF4 family)
MESELTATESTKPSAWHPLTRMMFRFLVLYFGMFTLRMVTWILLGGDLPWASNLYRWVASTLFRTEIRFVTGDSSDTTYDHGIVATHLALAAIGALLWSILGWRHKAYPRLFDAQWMAMRFVLSTALIMYGFSKIYALQMPSPSLFKLSTPLGNLSPTELLWNFMGASPTYQRIAGWLEFVPGILLLFRRTQLLAALVAAGVLMNVWLMNMCYGVCVKILSFHLLAIACVIILPDASRLFRFVVLQQAVEPRKYVAPWRSVWLKRFLSWGRLLWIAIVMGFVFVYIPYRLDYFSPPSAKVEPESNPLQGQGFSGRTWEVSGFHAEGSDTLNREPWRMIKLQGEGGLLLTSLPTAGKESHFWALQTKPALEAGMPLPPEGQMSVTVLSRALMNSIYRSTEESAIPEPAGELRYRITGPIANPSEAHFSGELLLDGRPVRVQFTLIKPTLRREAFRLTNTPFRWIQEFIDGLLQ